MPSFDYVNDLIDNIESQGFDYVIGIIKPQKDNPDVKDIDIYTNKEEDGLDKLLAVLSKNYKSRKGKKDLDKKA